MPPVRRLTAILAADVAGYSRLMGADEEGTHERLKAHLGELVEPKIAQHRGRIVKNTGDGFLADFASVVDAVRCAVEIQRGMVEREFEVPEERRIRFRIGVNLGDVIAEEDDIFGDGVNVAARLEGLAEPGAVLISHTVHDQVRDRLSLAFEDLGEQQVKNIARPVRVYRVCDAGIAAKSPSAPGQSALSLPDKLSIKGRRVQVFISYHTPDLDKARAVEAALAARRPGTECYLAPRNMTAGAYWMPALAEAIARADAVLFLAGARIGPWQELEYQEALHLSRQSGGRPRIVPIVMAAQAPGLPFFAQLHQVFAADPAAAGTPRRDRAGTRRKHARRRRAVAALPALQRSAGIAGSGRRLLLRPRGRDRRDPRRAGTPSGPHHCADRPVGGRQIVARARRRHGTAQITGLAARGGRLAGWT